MLTLRSSTAMPFTRTLAAHTLLHLAWRLLHLLPRPVSSPLIRIVTQRLVAKPALISWLLSSSSNLSIRLHSILIHMLKLHHLPRSRPHLYHSPRYVCQILILLINTASMNITAIFNLRLHMNDWNVTTAKEPILHPWAWSVVLWLSMMCIYICTEHFIFFPCKGCCSGCQFLCCFNKPMLYTYIICIY